jgi:hypothetical protein
VVEQVELMGGVSVLPEKAEKDEVMGNPGISSRRSILASEKLPKKSQSDYEWNLIEQSRILYTRHLFC